jgi:hypothetical protein
VIATVEDFEAGWADGDGAVSRLRALCGDHCPDIAGTLDDLGVSGFIADRLRQPAVQCRLYPAFCRVWCQGCAFVGGCRLFVAVRMRVRVKIMYLKVAAMPLLEILLYVSRLQLSCDVVLFVASLLLQGAGAPDDGEAEKAQMKARITAFCTRYAAVPDMILPATAIEWVEKEGPRSAWNTIGILHPAEVEEFMKDTSFGTQRTATTHVRPSRSNAAVQIRCCLLNWSERRVTMVVVEPKVWKTRCSMDLVQLNQ